jgi:phosphopantetheinyl transferase
MVREKDKTYLARLTPPPGILTLYQRPQEDKGLTLVDIHTVGRIFHSNNKLFDHWLSPKERLYLDNLRFQKRYNEWLSGRVAAKWGLSKQSNQSFKPAAYTILPDIHGCPQIDPILPGRYISISHSHQFCAALTANTPCGVDIQKIDRKILKLKKRVATEMEINIVKRETGNDDETVMTIIWSIKETVKKHCLSSQPGIFEAINIQSIRTIDEKGRYSAECFINAINHKQDVNIIRLDKYILAWSTKKRKNA